VGRSRIPLHILLFLAIAVFSPLLWAQDAPTRAGQAAAGRAETDIWGLQGPVALEGAVDARRYVLGAGDVLKIGFWGEVNRHETVYVNPDGDVLIVPVGPIKVDGLTLAEARELIRERLSPYYTPAVLSVSLVAVRTFQVHVAGMVSVPGAYGASAVTRVSQVVALAGSLDAEASLRNIEIRRDDGPTRADLTRYSLLGDNSANPFLRDGDVVYVPPERGQVHIYGSVYRQGDYEFVEGESLAELVELAGGYRPEALTDSLEVQRFESDDPTRWVRFFLGGDSATVAAFELHLDDYVFVRSIPDWHEDAHVIIEGEVLYPGRYVIDEGVEVLSDVVERAGGFTQEASLAEAVLIRGLYLGQRSPAEAELEALVEAGGSMDWKEKDLFKTLAREPKGAASISLASLYAGDGFAFDPPLYDGDVIRVPRATNAVRVAGHVQSPGLIPYVEGQYAGYYIREAGGHGSRADKRGTRVIRGKWGQKLKSGDSKVVPGDVIWVPEKKERDGWETFRDLVWVVAQIATVFLIIDSATKD
jgi:polysaccharide export outer membrane protein